MLLVELCAILNSPLPPDDKFGALCDFIAANPHPELFNTPVYVSDSEMTRPKPESIPPVWLNTTASRRYEANSLSYFTGSSPLLFNSNHFKQKQTHLINIIATNELCFNHTQIATLLNLASRFEANFDLIDQSNFHGNPSFERADNNALKSLIAISAADEAMHPILEVVIDSLAEAARQASYFQRTACYVPLFNHVDRFIYGRNSPTTFLLRIGLEHLALKLYQTGLIKLSITDLAYACVSLGTTQYTQECLECINLIAEQLPAHSTCSHVDPDTQKRILDSLRFASREHIQEIRARKTTIVTGWINSLRFGHRPDGTIYEQACQKFHLPHPETAQSVRAIQAQLIRYLVSESINAGNKDLFSDYYRSETQNRLGFWQHKAAIFCYAEPASALNRTFSQVKNLFDRLQPYSSAGVTAPSPKKIV